MLQAQKNWDNVRIIPRYPIQINRVTSLSLPVLQHPVQQAIPQWPQVAEVVRRLFEWMHARA